MWTEKQTKIDVQDREAETATVFFVAIGYYYFIECK